MYKIKTNLLSMYIHYWKESIGVITQMVGVITRVYLLRIVCQNNSQTHPKYSQIFWKCIEYARNFLINGVFHNKCMVFRSHSLPLKFKIGHEFARASSSDKIYKFNKLTSIFFVFQMIKIPSAQKIKVSFHGFIHNYS